MDFNALPLPVSILLTILTVSAFSLIFLLPIVLLLKAEKQDFSTWWRDHLCQSQSPLLRASAFISSVNVLIGRCVCWLVIAMALMQFTVVLMRYVFSLGSTQMQESIWYLHGMVFTLGVGYTLYREGHVRIDVIYQKLSIQAQAIINIFGFLCFIVPLCWVTLDTAYPYVVHAWEVKEGSTEGSGLHYVYLIKSTILIFAILLLLQGTALFLKSLDCLVRSRQTSP